MKLLIANLAKKTAYALISIFQPLVRLECPTFLTLSYPYELLKGWYLVPLGYDLKTMRVEGTPVAFETFRRKDIEINHASRSASGFNTILNFENLKELVSKDQLSVEFQFVKEGKRSLNKKLNLRIDPNLKLTLSGSEAARSEKQLWLKNQLCCPTCHENKNLSINDQRINCSTCGNSYMQTTRGLNLIDADSVQEFHIVPTGNISANDFEPLALSLIEEVRKIGGRVLDCGAGFRKFSDSTVINLEIVDYPSTDILAVGQKLPFRNETFDGILSSAVLEHVSDPFLCAKEIIRVLKPGGKLLCIVPFMQNEHGYPDHYFNMTRSGLLQLFRGQMKVQDQFVPLSGHPIFAVHKLLSIYRENLPIQSRKSFEKLKIREFLDRSELAWLNDKIGKDLPQDKQWEIASTTAVMLNKV
jgi:SAM-dependent methyltransferase